MNFLRTLSHVPTYTLDIFYPNNCSVCESHLNSSEQFLCLKCRYDLPLLTQDQTKSINSIFTGRTEIKQVYSLLNYQKGNQASTLMRGIKYHGKTKLAAHLAEQVARQITDSSIDAIIPLPLHPKKERQRGYNQSLAIAKGIMKELKVPIQTKSIKRTTHNPSQTKVSKFDRWENVRSIFEVRKPKEVQNKHILLVDDVLTTGATLEACAVQLIEKHQCTVSVATLASRI